MQSDLVAIVHVGDKEYPVKTTSASQTIIEVPKGTDEVTVTIQGAVDLGYTEVKNKDENITQDRIYPPYDSDHKSITFKLTDSKGNLAEGPYQALIKYNFRAWEPVTGQTIYKTTAYREFTIKFVEPSTDKTELQSLYDEVKGKTSENSYFEYFNQELQDTQSLLDNASATQEEIDKQIIALNAKYYALLVAELNETYDPNKNSFNEYTTDSLIPVIKMWGNTNEKINKDYYESESNDNVGQGEKWYNDYKNAIDGLTKASGSELKVGLNTDSATKFSQYQGHFEVVSKKPVEGDSTKYEVTIQFINDGKHPIYGETKVNSSNTTKYKPYTDLSKSSIINVTAYGSDFGFIKQALAKNVTTLPESEDYNDGIQVTYVIESNAKYLTFEFKATSSSNPTYSEGYFVVDNIPTAVDKSDLQSLIEETKDYQSDDSYYDEFQEALTNPFLSFLDSIIQFFKDLF